MIDGLPPLPVRVAPGPATAPGAAAPADFLAMLATDAATRLEAVTSPSTDRDPAPEPVVDVVLPDLVPVVPPTIRPIDVAAAGAETPSPIAGATPPEPLPPTTTLHHASEDGGDRNVVALAWHLQANAGLSWQSAIHAGAALPVDLAMPVAIATAKPAPAAGNPEGNGVAMRGFLADEAWESRSVVALAMQRNATVRSERGAAAGPDAATEGWHAPWLAWPERLLRWHGENDGSASAWVRDYRLDAGQARQLVDALRELAGQQDIPLRRIVLNGHELWRAPTASTTR